ncbi:hypothetical protein MKX07_004441 [Trichoderma sp. CBMAI-0711]|nr:hypothetical protein MKX07_004441 [Trichoderma sp. CBMAI-0711]
MSPYDFKVVGKPTLVHMESLQGLALLSRKYKAKVDNQGCIDLVYQGREVTPEEIEVRRGWMERCLLKLRYTKLPYTGEGPQRFVQPDAEGVAVQNDAMTTDGESTEEHLMDEKTLIDEEDQVDQDAVCGKEDPNQRGRVTEEYRNAEDSRIAQQHVDYEVERISRGFEYLGETLPRWSWGRAGIR